MSGQYEKYIVRKPDMESLPFGNEIPEDQLDGKTGSNIYLSNKLIPGSDTHMNLIWIYTVPTPNPYVLNHSHPYNEVLFWIGTDPDNLEDLHAEVEFGIGGETYSFDTTTAVYLPAELEHCPIKYNRVDRPHMFIALSLGGAYGGKKLF